MLLIDHKQQLYQLPLQQNRLELQAHIPAKPHQLQLILKQALQLQHIPALARSSSCAAAGLRPCRLPHHLMAVKTTSFSSSSLIQYYAEMKTGSQ